jgi:hypothetical protein
LSLDEAYLDVTENLKAISSAVARTAVQQHAQELQRHRGVLGHGGLETWPSELGRPTSFMPVEDSPAQRLFQQKKAISSAQTKLRL